MFKIEWKLKAVRQLYKVSIPRQSRGLYDCWPLKGASSQSEKTKTKTSM